MLTVSDRIMPRLLIWIKVNAGHASGAVFSCYYCTSIFSNRLSPFQLEHIAKMNAIHACRFLFPKIHIFLQIPNFSPRNSPFIPQWHILHFPPIQFLQKLTIVPISIKQSHVIPLPNSKCSAHSVHLEDSSQHSPKNSRALYVNFTII